jgi:hypothetical protein
MVYLGPWQPREVRGVALAQQRPPRELFLEMTEGTNERLWPEEAEDWHLTFHAFRCTGCGTHRGAIDLD